MSRRDKRTFRRHQNYCAVYRSNHLSWRDWRRTNLTQKIQRREQEPPTAAARRGRRSGSISPPLSQEKKCRVVQSTSSHNYAAHIVIFSEGTALHTHWKMATGDKGLTISVRHTVAFVHDDSGTGEVVKRRCDKGHQPYHNGLQQNDLFNPYVGPTRSLFWLCVPEGQSVRGSTFFANCNDLYFWDASSSGSSNTGTTAAATGDMHASWRSIHVPRVIRQRLLTFLKCDGTYTSEMHPDPALGPFDCGPFALYLAGVHLDAAFRWTDLRCMPESYTPRAGDLGVIAAEDGHGVHVMLYLDANITISRFGNADMIIVASPASVLETYSADWGGKRIFVYQVSQ